MPVNSPCAEYIAAAPKWKRMRDCIAGRDAILKAGKDYLPELPGNPKGYADYAKRGSFYNATKRTIQGLAGSVFQKPPVLEGVERIQNLLDDVSPRGKVPFELFALRTLNEVIAVGRVGILVDMPAEASPDAKPYAVLFNAEDIISWRMTRIGSDEVLSLVVLREEKTEQSPKDPFVMEACEQYRVLELRQEGAGLRYYQSLWVPSNENKAEYVMQGEITPTRRGKPLDFIPFAIIGTTGVSPDVEAPPLEALADVNLAHWRNSVDHEYGLHLVALPTPWVAGAKASDPTNTAPMPIGPSVVWELEKDGSAGMLEFSGAGLASILAAMKEKEHQMATLGARLLEDQAGASETATAVGMRHAGEHASLRTMAGATGEALTEAVKWLSWWTGAEAKPSDVKATVTLNKEFFVMKLTPDELRSLVTTWQAEGMDWETLYFNMQRGGMTRPGVTAEEEKAAIEADAPEPVEPPDQVDSPEPSSDGASGMPMPPKRPMPPKGGMPGKVGE